MIKASDPPNNSLERTQPLAPLAYRVSYHWSRLLCCKMIAGPLSSQPLACYFCDLNFGTSESFPNEQILFSI